MASTYWQPDNTPIVQFTGPDKRRRKIRLSYLARNERTGELVRNKTTERDVNRFVEKLEGLVKAVRSGKPLDAEVELWLGDLPAAERKKFEAYGLARKTSGELQAEADAARKADEDAAKQEEVSRRAAIPRLGELIDAYITVRAPKVAEAKADNAQPNTRKKRGTVKPGTATFYGHTKRNLVEFFGADKVLAEVNAGDAEDFYLWLMRPTEDGGQGIAESTACRRCNLANQFFRYAVKKGYAGANPFEDVGGSVVANKSRQEYISRADTEKLISAAPNADWRLIIALSRYAGLRMPSEINNLRLDEIDWERNRFLVHSPKTEHHQGKESRLVPIFPELRKHLRAVWEAAPEMPPAPKESASPTERKLIEAERELKSFVFPGYRNKKNLRTRFATIIKRAGLKQWPKIFHNLRSSCQTDLAVKFPLHLVCEWLGNSAAIAQKHYLQITDADYERAADGATSGAISAHSGVVSDAQASPSPESDITETSEKLVFATSEEVNQWAIQDSTNRHETPVNIGISSQVASDKASGGAISGAIGHEGRHDCQSGGELEDTELAKLWPTLPRAAKREALAVIAALAADVARLTTPSAAEVQS